VFCHIVKINYVAIRKPVCSRQTVDRSPSPQPLPIDHQPLTARPIYAHLSPAEIVFFSFTPMTLVIPTPSALGLAHCVGYHSLSLFVPVTVSFPKSNYFLWKYYTGAYTHTICIYIYVYYKNTKHIFGFALLCPSSWKTIETTSRYTII